MQNKKNIIHWFAIASIVIFSSCSPVNKFTRFKKLPREYSLNYCGENIKAPVTDYNKEIWIVFSDRDANPTYQSPGGKVKLKEASFGEPFLVIKEKGEYLRLVKYDPEIVDNSLTKTKIKNKDKAQYYGWINKANLVLSKQSITDISTGFKNKAVSIISDTTALIQSKVFIKNDSIQVFKDEGLTKENGKMPFYEFLYILKTSADHKKSLVARKVTISPEKPEIQIIGWVHSSLVKNIGQRLYVDIKSVPQSDLMFRKLNGLPDDLLSVTHETFYESLRFSQKKNTFKYAPVISYKQTSNHDVLFKTGIPAHVLDPNSYYVLNVNGDKVNYSTFKNWEKELRKLNIVFVFEGKRQVINSFPKIVNVIQNLQPLFEDENDIFQYKFGSILAFQGNGGGVLAPLIKTVGLTNSYSDLLNALDVEANNMSKYNPLPMKDTWSGLRKAVDMVSNPNKKDETSLLVVIGESGDSERVDTTLMNRVADANCRVLGFQLYGEESNTGNNFVLQMSDLIKYYADRESMTKREKIVYADQITPSNDYRESSKNIYALDFPKNSMTQGWVLFPEKNVDLPLNSLSASIDTLISEVKFDNNNLINSLDKAFNSIAKYRAEYNPLWLQYNQLDRASLSKSINIDAESPMWYLPSRTLVFSDSIQQNMKFNLLLSETELNNLIEFMKNLYANEVDYKYVGEAHKARKRCNCPDDDLLLQKPAISIDPRTGMPEYKNTKKVRSKLSKLYIDELTYCKLCKHTTGEIKNFTLSEALFKITGCPSTSPKLTRYTISNIKQKEYLSDKDLDLLITYFKEKKEVLEGLLTAKKIEKFESNGETYYWLNQQLLP